MSDMPDLIQSIFHDLQSMKPYQSFLIFGTLCLVVIGISMLPFSGEEDYEIEVNEISSIHFKWETKLVGEKVGSRILIDELNDRLYVMTFSTLTALALETGETLWMNDESGGNQWADHVIQLQGDTLLAKGNDRPVVRAFSSETGDILWEWDYSQNSDRSEDSNIFSILSDLDRVYVVTSRWNRGTDIDALDMYTGVPLWNVPNRLFGANGPDIFQLTPNRLYIEAGQLFGLDKLTGEVLEAYPQELRVRQTGYIEEFSAFYLEKSVRAARLYPNEEEQSWGVKWETNPEGCRDQAAYMFSAPGATSDALYVGATCHSLLKLSKENGDLMWAADTTGTPRVIAVKDDELFALTDRANLAQIDISTGEIVGTIQFKPRSRHLSGQQALAYAKGWLIVSNGNNQIFAFQKTQ